MKGFSRPPLPSAYFELETNRPNIYEIYTNRAMALNKLERYKEALKDAETALRMSPDYALAKKVKELIITNYSVTKQD